MTPAFAAGRQFLTDLFAGPFARHGFIVDPPREAETFPGDVAISERPVRDWLPGAVRNFELARDWHEQLRDDAVPFGRITTGTETFAAAFGCEVHLFEDSMPAARPLVSSAREAEALPQPDFTARPLERMLEMAQLLVAELGPGVPVGGMDYQSAFDIAALVWNKQDLFLAMVDAPEAVHGLVRKCQMLLEGFTREFLRVVPDANLCHCPLAWAPPELGFWLSEDEAGSMSVPMFEAFCLPGLVELSEKFGGLFMHCCAAADHQYPSFRKIPNLRGLNRVFQAPGPEPAVEAFAGETVLMLAWAAEEGVRKMLAMARPQSRFLFNMGAVDLEAAKGMLERVRGE
jgi:hypothetical protein